MANVNDRNKKLHRSILGNYLQAFTNSYATLADPWPRVLFIKSRADFACERHLFILSFPSSCKPSGKSLRRGRGIWRHCWWRKTSVPWIACSRRPGDRAGTRALRRTAPANISPWGINYADMMSVDVGTNQLINWIFATVYFLVGKPSLKYIDRGFLWKDCKFIA